MRKDKGGKGGVILNISSTAALCQMPLSPIYSATKSAVLQFSNCIGVSINKAFLGINKIRQLIVSYHMHRCM